MMADEQKMTVRELLSEWEVLKVKTRLATHHETTGFLFNFQNQLLEVIQVQDARIKTLEDRLDMVHPETNIK